MIPVDVIEITMYGEIKSILHYTNTGLDIAKRMHPDGIRLVNLDAMRDWFAATGDHHVELVGGLHGRGRFYGHDRKTGEVRSLYADMKELGYAVEDGE
jgi:hypothetical protein